MKFAYHFSKAHIQQFNQVRRFAENQREKPKPVQQQKFSRKYWDQIIGKYRKSERSCEEDMIKG